MNINNLTLAKNLTTLTNQAGEGLQTGNAPILEQVTPTTAELLKWWFQADFCENRAFNFHSGQRQAILNTIYAHEVLGAKTLKALYVQVAPDELLADKDLLNELSQPKHAHPKYCLKMATGTGKTWVLQTLLIWQALNKQVFPDDERFTRHFLIVAPGLIVYERLLDAFLGKGGNFASSDLARYHSLFVPDTYREQIDHFVQTKVCTKDEIGSKVTGNGMIAITNWHLLAEVDDEQNDITPSGSSPDPKHVVKSLLPISPGKSAGNALEQLDRNYLRGAVLDYLANLSELMVFNDEAHHIHIVKKAGEISEVEWQKSLLTIAANKNNRFVQIDFSATPYNQVGTPAQKIYFPHISVDFDLKTAMRTGLVKSLVLDKRREIGALPLEFKAERDADGKAILSEGQRVMLRAGLAKLIKLETDFAKIYPQRFPKMLVVCEDTYVTPCVVAFLQEEGLKEDEIMAIDSTQKGELKPREWQAVRERLFDVDSHATPRVIVNVLMLREGFDVNNICVIVPLRTTGSSILLEQTIGRGLRLMWRESEYSDIKQENRHLINQGKEPQSLIDILSIVEHPAFQHFYDELMQEGLVGTTSEENEDCSSTGDLMTVGLREDYAKYDFAIPFILREADESLRQHDIDHNTLAPFDTLTLPQLKNMIGKGDVFTSEDVQSKTRFGDYRVESGIMTATGYNDFVARLTNRLSVMLNAPITKSAKTYANQSHFPHLQINRAKLAGWVDNYIRHRLFNTHFIPLEDENWRILLLDVIAQHILTTLARALLAAENTETTALAEVTHRYLSEVPKLTLRESASLPVNKCIYERLPYPTKSGGFEKSFIELANHDGQVEAFCKINEQKHDFARLRYVKDDGLPAYYSPDFLVRTQSAIYLVETKAQAQMNHPNVQRKQRAAVAWCDRINELTLEQRQKCDWHYVLLGEDLFYEWRDKNARLDELLQFAKLRSLDEKKQAGLW